MENQTNITDIYSELSYDELKSVLEGWLNPTTEEGQESVSEQTLSTPKQSTPAPASAPSTPKTEPVVEDRKKLDDVASAFDDLFNG
jgi:hypothetical protein